MLLFETERLQIRNLAPDDYPTLARWLTNDEVLQYYEGRDNPHDLAKVTEVYGRKLDRNVTPCIVQCGEQPIGYIQFYPLTAEDKEEYQFFDEVAVRVYGLDQFIGEPSYWNRGIGTELTCAMTAYLRDVMQVDAVVMDPQVWNTRAIRCYEKAGFKKICMLPKHERHEGEMRDCWLMGWSAQSHQSTSRSSVRLAEWRGGLGR